MKSSTIRKCIKRFFKWVNHVSIYRPRSRGHLASSKRSLGCFFTKESGENTFSHEPQQFCMMVQSGGSISIIFVFLERFTWLCENFTWSCEIAFHFSLSMLQPKPILFHFAWPCEIFAWSCEIEKHAFSTPLCNFSNFFLLIPLQLPSNQLQISVQTDCIAYFIMHLDHHQLYLFSSILIHLFCHQFIKIIPWNDSKTSSNLLVTLARAIIY